MDWVDSEEFESWDRPFDKNNKEISAQVMTPKDRNNKINKIRLRGKRHRQGKIYGEPPAKRPAPSIRLGAGFKWNLQTLANAANAVQSGGKSPVSALNELGVKVHYTVLRQGGPAHCPSFTVAVTVADMTFEGWGHSKREARASAAKACLAALLARAGRVLPAPNQNQDFTSDEPAKYPVSEFQCLETKMKTDPVLPTPVPDTVPEEKNGITNGNAMPPPQPATPSSSPSTALFGSTVAPAANKSPINILYENYTGLTFTCTFGDGSPLDSSQAPLQLSHSMRFKVVCQIKNQKFEGYGSSKKLAKLAAARSALAVLDEGRVECVPATAPAGFLHQTLADHIGKLVNEKFNDLMKNDLVHSKRKVLAGIVITINNRTDNARVIAVTTGTKCVSGEHMSVTGRVVNDCHAEVAARRCLQRHLYSQLLMYTNQSDPRIPIPECDLEPVHPSGYQLKSDRQIHMYISTAPCGDGRIFSPHEQQDGEPDKHPNRLARGQLRTKMESGEGTIPVKNCTNVIQTWDGVLQGERLLTMSCSDKVARWCVVGLRGSLLSRLITPVYLHSLVLGSLMHPHHMYRALCGRIEAYISSLPPPFRLHRPLLARAASTEARTPARAPSFSVCWCSTTPLPEVINATTGKLESGQPSLLCKQSMFARWQYLIKRLSHVPQVIELETNAAPIPENLEELLYNEAKQLCPIYQLAKSRLIESFEKAKLGRWIQKPIEQNQFVCKITTTDTNALFAWAGVYHAWDSMLNVVEKSGLCEIENEQNGIVSVQVGSKNDQNNNIKNIINENEENKPIDNNNIKDTDGKNHKCVANNKKNMLDNGKNGRDDISSSFDKLDDNYEMETNNNCNLFINSIGNINNFKDNPQYVVSELINDENCNVEISKKIKLIRDVRTRLKKKIDIDSNTAQFSSNQTAISDGSKDNETKIDPFNCSKCIFKSISKNIDDMTSVTNILENQRIINDSHLVSKEAKSRYLKYVSNMEFRRNSSIDKTKIVNDLVDTNMKPVKTVKSTDKNNNTKENNKIDNNTNKIEHVNVKDSIKEIQEKISDINLDDRKKFWCDFYKKRQAKRTILNDNNSDNYFNLRDVGDNNNLERDKVNCIDHSEITKLNTFAGGGNGNLEKDKVNCIDNSVITKLDTFAGGGNGNLKKDKINYIENSEIADADSVKYFKAKAESSYLKNSESQSKITKSNRGASKSTCNEYVNFDLKTMHNLRKISEQAISLDGDIDEFIEERINLYSWMT